MSKEPAGSEQERAEAIEAAAQSVRRAAAAKKLAEAELAGARLALVDLLGPAARAAMKNKTHGTAKFAVAGIPFQAEIKREVRWNSDDLKSAAEELDLTAEQCELFFKSELSIPEAIWSKMPEGPIKDRFSNARTADYKPLAISPVEA